MMIRRMAAVVRNRAVPPGSRILNNLRMVRLVPLAVNVSSTGFDPAGSCAGVIVGSAACATDWRNASVGMSRWCVH